MPAPTTADELLDLLQKSGLVEEPRLRAYVERLRAAGTFPADPGKLAGVLVRDALLTFFQAEQLLQGKYKRFSLGKYKVLEKLGSGGMGTVFLCEHKLMRRRVAVKASMEYHRQRGWTVTAARMLARVGQVAILRNAPGYSEVL